MEMGSILEILLILPLNLFSDFEVTCAPSFQAYSDVLQCRMRTHIPVQYGRWIPISLRYDILVLSKQPSRNPSTILVEIVISPFGVTDTQHAAT